MKKALIVAIVVSVGLIVLPAIAGEGHDHGQKAAHEKCSADAQACLNMFAQAYRGRGWAGVSLEMSEDGLSVSEVHPGTPAERAGIKTGDVLLAINGIKPGNEAEMAGLRDQMVPGHEMTYTISRKGRTKDVQFELEEMPTEVIARMVGMHMLNDHAAVEIATADD